MNKQEFLSKMEKGNLVETKIASVEKVYGVIKSDILKRLISLVESEPIFFDKEYRLISLSEILSANEELYVDFVKLGLIPFFDTYDNDFIVYNLGKSNWAKFNIVDCCLFKERENLSDLLK